MNQNDSLRLIVMNNIKEFGGKVDKYLMEKRKSSSSFIIPIQEVRFNNGEGKISIKETVRKKDVYILADVGNHNCSYDMYGKTSYIGPDEHFQDIKRIICAIEGHASSVTVVMPLLYSSRQHRRKGRESLDCAIALQELEKLGVDGIITYDAHDPNIQNAIPCLPFDNFYPTGTIIESMINNGHIDLKNVKKTLVVSPDTGAMDRARFYADVLSLDVGMCYKRRDLTRIVNGKNPIVAHEYIGKNVKGKDIIIVDDMIASGGSILECASELKKRGANNIYMACSFALFTEGVRKFRSYYKKGIFTGVYSTNLTDVDEKIKSEPWFYQVDCSNNLSEIINTLNNGESISPLLNSKMIAMETLKIKKEE